MSRLFGPLPEYLTSPSPSLSLSHSLLHFQAPIYAVVVVEERWLSLT